ncbi:unnamed protein product [Brassica rapa subsp. narinosa]
MLNLSRVSSKLSDGDAGILFLSCSCLLLIHSLIDVQVHLSSLLSGYPYSFVWDAMLDVWVIRALVGSASWCHITSTILSCVEIRGRLCNVDAAWEAKSRHCDIGGIFSVMMDMYKDDSSPYCYFHPKEKYVGVCPFCLNERLLVLASKQRSSRTKHLSSSPIIGSLPKIFALSSLLSRLDLRLHRKFHPSSDLDVSTSQEDSFISIKFGNDGNASWERKTVSKVCVDNNTNSTCKTQQSPITSIVEYNSPKSSLKWRKRIGHLFHVIKLRSGSSTSSCHVASSSSKVEGTKVRKQGWMVRTLTRRKSKKSKS